MSDFQLQETSLTEDEIHLRDYWRIIQKRWKLLASFFIVTFITVALVTIAQVPKYTATSQLLIEKGEAVKLTNNWSNGPYDPFFLDTQFEIIKSKNVINRVVESLKLDSKYKKYFIDDEKDFTVIKSIKSTIKDFIHFIVPEKKDSLSLDDLASAGDAPTTADLITDILRKELSIQPVRKTNVVNVSLNNENPVIAKLIVNNIAKSYIEELLEIKIKSSNYTIAWLTKKSNEAKKKLESSERALQDYSKRQDLITIEDRIAITPQQLTDNNSQYLKAKAKRQELEEVYKQIATFDLNDKKIESFSLFAENKDLQNIRQKILLADQNISELSKKFGSKHPAMVKAKEEKHLLTQERHNIIQRISDSIKNQYHLARDTEKNMKKLLFETKHSAIEMNEKLIQYNSMKREIDTNRILFEALLKQIKEKSATEQTQSVQVVILEEADVPMEASSPRKGRNLLLALILGLSGGVGLVFFVEYLDNTIGDPTEIENRFNIPVLGTIKYIKEYRKKNKQQKKTTDVLNIETDSSLAESYRVVRSSLMLSASDTPPKIILVTSSLQGEGKSTTCINLARTIALEGKKVLLIDADLRRPRLHHYLDLPNQTGLSSFLAGISKENIICQTKSQDVECIPAGPCPPNPAELLGSKAMQRLLELVSEKYDCIVVDSAPLLSVTDSHALSSLADGVILVVRANTTNYEVLGATIKKIRSLQATLSGAILNAKPLSKYTNSLQYYGGYYANEYLHQNEEEEKKEG